MEVEGGKKKSSSSILRWMKKKSTKKGMMMRKSKSWSGGEPGWFSVYVGPEKERFVIKTEAVNHPLFKMLLEDAEMEYGFNSDGPLLLPCHVDLFVTVLAEMDYDGRSSSASASSSACHLISHGCRGPFTPARRRGGSAAYGLLMPMRSFN